MSGEASPQPSAQGWLILKNRNETELVVLIEPWGVGPVLRPGGECRIFLKEPRDPLPEIHIAKDMVVIFAADSAVEVDGEVTHDFRD